MRRAADLVNLHVTQQGLGFLSRALNRRQGKGGARRPFLEAARTWPLVQLAHKCFAELWEFSAQRFRRVWASKVLKILHPHVSPAQVSGSHSVPSLGLTLRRSV